MIRLSKKSNRRHTCIPGCRLKHVTAVTCHFQFIHLLFFVVPMLICLYPPYYARCAQFFPFQHLQQSGLLQLEEGGINAEFVGAAVPEDVVDIYTAGKQLQITNNILRIQFFVIHHYSHFIHQCASYLQLSFTASDRILLENTSRIESGSSALNPLAYPSGTHRTRLSLADR